ncbi:small ribosomal subunit protein eS8-like [Acropora palmata]|uniref:small ribosomal subunit protein eS8-like n=1 Tax=Acropora palmata TaxID=6131 RepID=UPI003DA1A669
MAAPTVCLKSCLRSLSTVQFYGRVGSCSLQWRCVTRSWQFDHCGSFHSSALVLGGRKRSEWRQDRVPAHTRLRLDKPEKIKERKAFGGHKKTKGIKIKTGLYAWNSLDVEFECPILKVVHNTANDNFTKNGVMVKGTIVEIDSNPFKTWYSTHNNKENPTAEASTNLPQLLPFMETGKFYAKITTRPGQVGMCNGYVLEGEELETFLNSREDLGLAPPNQSAAK